MREGVDVFTFDSAIIRRMEQQDRLEYKHPWAVIGSTDSHLDAGSTVYLRKYPWGNALSSEPAHSDLPALRNLLMWSGQWLDLKLSARVKYEQWRATQGPLQRTSSAAAALGRHMISRAASCAAPAVQRSKALMESAKDAAAAVCANVGMPPRLAARALLVLLAALLVLPSASLVRHVLSGDASLARELNSVNARLSTLVEENEVRNPNLSTILIATIPTSRPS